MRLPVFLLAVSLAVVAAIWWWLGAPLTLARAPLDPGVKLQCVSYAPFRDGQSPLNSTLRVSAAQIEEDLKQLAQISQCVRTYAVDNGLDQVPALAQAAGLKVLQGIWLGSDRAGNARQIARAVELAKEFPGTVTALIAGNEVLLRGEMTGADLAATVRQVKQLSPVPVTYADVWEFWLRHRDVADAADFVTIHILPYWEDFPVPARNAADHVGRIRRQMALAFPGKDILIGETGWPSAGRMREGALPSRTNQARVVSEILALAEREQFRVNLIEAYDQPWKRQIEGTVGGYWGFLDAYQRVQKYSGRAISDHPRWLSQMGLGLIVTLAVFAVGWLGARRRGAGTPTSAEWLGVAVTATVAGALAGLAIEKAGIEALGLQGWLRSGALIAVAGLTALVGSFALTVGLPIPPLDLSLAAKSQVGERSTLPRVSFSLSLLIAAICLLAVMTALGFVFDARYRDFPFDTLTVALVPLAALAFVNRAQQGVPRRAERAIAATLVACAVYVLFNEGFRNWQAIWTCLVFAGLALTLWPARYGQTPAA